MVLSSVLAAAAAQLKIYCSVRSLLERDFKV